MSFDHPYRKPTPEQMRRVAQLMKNEQQREKDQLSFLKWFRRPSVDPNPRPDEAWHAAFAKCRKEEVEPLKRSIEGFVAKEGNKLIRWNDDGTYTIQRGAK